MSREFLENMKKRQEKKVNAKLKNKKAKGSAERPAVAAGLQSPPHPQILNHAGQPVKSKFDFSIISTGDKEKVCLLLLLRYFLKPQKNIKK